MLTDRPDGSQWREEIFRRMNAAAAVLHNIESHDPYPVEPASDLAGDRDQVPDLWVDTLATRRLKVAVDYLAGIRDLVNTGTHFHAPYALLRAVLESSATAVWLLDPEERKTRLELAHRRYQQQEGCPRDAPGAVSRPLRPRTGHHQDDRGRRITKEEVQIPRLHKRHPTHRRLPERWGVDGPGMETVLRNVPRNRLGSAQPDSAN